MAAPERDRVAEVIVETRDRIPARRGSGYRITDSAVLTAAHVVTGGGRIRVRFTADLPGEWSVAAQVAAADLGTDVAILGIVLPVPAEDVTPALFGALGERAATLDCMVVGFPRFKLREDLQGAADGPLSRYRDSHQANGTISPLSNWREGSLEIRVPAPAPDPDSRHSPWEGMSGAAVWCKGRIIGVVSKQHPRDGLGCLAVSRIDRLYGSLEPGFLAAVCELAGLPAQRDQLADVSSFTDPGVMECPYRGLQPYTAEDARFFFGRQEVTAQLLEALVEEPLIALIGASGSGKSSVLSAGFIPAASALDDSGYHCALITPTADPIGQLADAISSWPGVAVSGPWDDPPARIADALASGPPPQPLLLIVDQMEELHTLCADEQARRAFIQGLLALISSGTARDRVVIGIRSDFYAQCADDPDLGPAMDNRQVNLRPMGKAELRSIIERPAALTGLHIDPRLTEVLLADVGDEPGKLPLLSHALLATFERRQGPQLTVEDYIAAGRIEGAINKTADNAYESLATTERDVVQAIFIRFTAGDGTIPDTRRSVRRADLDPETFPSVDAILDRLASAHLITLTTDRAGQQTVEVVHEALIRSWGRLAGWLDSYRRYRPVHQDLIAAAGKWHMSGRSPGWLYHGSNLEEARELLADNSPVRLTRTERDFLAASRAAARRRSRRFRLLVSGLTVTMLVAGVGVATAVTQSGQKNAQHRIAQSRALAAEAIADLSSNPEESLRLALNAAKITPSGPAEQALRLALAQDHLRMVIRSGTGAPTVASWNPNRAQVAVTAPHDSVALWDTATGRLTQLLHLAHAGAVTHLLYDADGTRLAAVSPAGYVSIWNIAANGNASAVPTSQFNSAIRAEAFPYDSSSGGITLNGTWSGRNGHEFDVYSTGLSNVLAFNVHSDGILPASRKRFPGTWDVAPNPAGTELFIDGSLVRRSTDNLISLSPPPPPLLGFGPACWFPDGSAVVTWSTVQAGGPERIYGAASGSLLAQMRTPSQPTTAVACSANRADDWVAAGDEAGNVVLRLAGGRLVSLDGHSKAISGIASSPDGHYLATASIDGTVRIWDASTGQLATVLHGGASLNSVQFGSSDGLVLTVDSGGLLHIWDTGLGDPVTELQTPSQGQTIIQGFSKDGKLITGADVVTTTGTEAKITPFPRSPGMRRPGNCYMR